MTRFIVGLLLAISIFSFFSISLIGKVDRDVITSTHWRVANYYVGDTTVSWWIQPNTKIECIRHGYKFQDKMNNTVVMPADTVIFELKDVDAKDLPISSVSGNIYDNVTMSNIDEMLRKVIEYNKSHEEQKK